MIRLTLPLLATLALLPGCSDGMPGGAAPARMELSANDRLLVLAPHPDDEVLGCGGVIQAANALGAPVHVEFLTHGDSGRWSFTVYRHGLPVTPGQARRIGEVRHGEALAADASLGVPPGRVSFLGYPDHGTLAVWYGHWGARGAYRSPLTRARAVPYPDALRPGAPYKGEEIVADLMSTVRKVRPTRILLSHPADEHPDHQALYLFTRIALWNLKDEIRPQLDPYLVHHPRWPQPARYAPALGLAPPRALAGEIAWVEVPLTPDAVAVKLKALREHRTQYESYAMSLRRFVRANELFGDLPAVVPAPGKATTLVAPGDEKLPPVLPEGLTRAEEEMFVEVRRIVLLRQGDELTMNVAFSRPLQREARLSLYVFGYRPDRPFGAMPKLHVQLGERGQAASDQDRKLPAGSLFLRREPREVILRIPLGLLGDPDRLLVSGRTYAGPVPLDWTPWRVVDLRPARPTSRRESQRPGSIGSQ